MKRNSSLAAYAVHGALAGFEATGIMTAAMGAAQRVGLLGRFPPKRIVQRALDAAGAHDVKEPGVEALTALAHLGFGMASGAAFGALYRGTRDLPIPAWIQGAAFGAAVWGLSYKGWVPALGILPPPKDDRPGRPTSMLISHLIYGAKLGTSVRHRCA